MQDAHQPQLHHWFVKRAVALAMDKHDKEREMTSVLLCSLHNIVSPLPWASDPQDSDRTWFEQRLCSACQVTAAALMHRPQPGLPGKTRVQACCEMQKIPVQGCDLLAAEASVLPCRWHLVVCAVWVYQAQDCAGPLLP